MTTDKLLEVLSETDLFVDTVEPVIEVLKEEWQGHGFSYEDNTLTLETNGNAKNEELVNILHRQNKFWALFHEETKEELNKTTHIFKISQAFRKKKEETLTDLSELKGIYTTEDIVKEFFDESFKELEKIKEVNKTYSLMKKLVRGEYDKDMPQKILDLKNAKWRKM